MADQLARENQIARDAPPSSGSNREKFILWLKWSIYVLLTLNFFYYLYEDMMSARFTLTSSSGILKWMENYVASFEAISWIVLILVYELETYWLDDDFSNKLVEGAMLTVKIVFAILILQTSFSYTSIVISLPQIIPLADVKTLCDLAGQDYSFLRDLRYTPVTVETCGEIPYEGTLYAVPREPVVMDTAGRMDFILLSIADIFENYSWLVILAMTELAVRLQNKGVFEGPALLWSNRIKYSAYLVIFVVFSYWLKEGYYVYAWDEFVWVAGFGVLDYNLRAWRAELRAESSSAQIDSA